MEDMIAALMDAFDAAQKAAREYQEERERNRANVSWDWNGTAANELNAAKEELRKAMDMYIDARIEAKLHLNT